MQEMWEQFKADIGSGAAGFAVKLVAAIIMFIIGIAVIKLVKRLMKKPGARKNVDKSAHSFFVSFVNIALWALLIVGMACYLGVPSASVMALIGSAGLALSLALQGSLSNLAGGLMMLIFKPFRVDDYIKTADGYEGTVQSITILYTTLVTEDGKNVVLPNASVSNSAVVNYSAQPARRVDIDVDVAYGTDTQRVKSALLSCVEGDDILSDPAPRVLLLEMKDSSLCFSLRVWCVRGAYLDVLYRLTQRAKDALDAADIAIPFPQLDVHVKDGGAQGTLRS